ncbi:hypothetical protein EON77_01035 [bacterium]|nr:MAG: hypothetical protein EON77_01035 [bacterium]
MTSPPNRYRDDNPLCARTYATLRLIHASADPDEVTRRFGIDPSDMWRGGESRQQCEGEWSETGYPNRDS